MNTPLCLAAFAGDVPEMRRLLRGGASVNQTSPRGMTPLYVAAQAGRVKAVKVLLAHKADVDKATDAGATPLFIAAQQGHTDVMMILLANKADFNKVDNEGATPLYVAAQKGHTVAAKILLDNGAQPDKVHRRGFTPFFVAAREGHTAAVRLLLSRLPATAINSTCGSLQLTALHFAAYHGHPSMVECLLVNGADPVLTDVDGQTALQDAQQENHPVCVAALQPRTIASLRPWSPATAAAFPRPYRGAVAVLLQQLSVQRPTGPTCWTDVLQGGAKFGGLLELLDCDWFTVDPAARLRTWLPAERRRVLGRWEAGDAAEVCGLAKAPELNGKIAVVKGYLPERRRFACALVEKEEEKTKQAGQGKRKGKKKKKAKKKAEAIIALRGENLVVRRCKACGKVRAEEAPPLRACGGCGLVYYCGAACQKAGWRSHKVLCRAVQKERKQQQAKKELEKKEKKMPSPAAAAASSGGGSLGAGQSTRTSRAVGSCAPHCG